MIRMIRTHRAALAALRNTTGPEGTRCTVKGSGTG